MFLDEVAERSARLIEGGKAMQQGRVDGGLCGTMLLESHTIKGTARVMGFEAMSRAGKLMEELWSGVKSGEIEPYPNLGRALVALAESLPEAAQGDPTAGTPAMVTGMEKLNRATGNALDDVASPEEPAAPPVAAQFDPEPDGPAGAGGPDPDDAPIADVVPLPGVPQVPVVPAVQPPPEAAPAVDAAVAPRHVPLESSPAPPPEPDADISGPDLGGLLSSLENWATGQTIQVGAGRFYRLVNYIAGLRVELDALLSRLEGAPEVAPDMVEQLADLVHTATSLEHDAMELGAVPVRQMTNTLPQLVRYLAKKLDKEIRFEISADDGLDVDRQVLDKISDPIRQLIVNAVNHGIEYPADRDQAGKATTGVISISLARHGTNFEVVVSDDGAGIDFALVREIAISQGLLSADVPLDEDMLRPILFFPGFTTRAGDELGSVGAGLSGVADAVESLYGRIRLESTPGVGTTVTLIVPTVRDLQRVLVVDAGHTKWGIPEAVVDEILPIEAADVETRGGRRVLHWKDSELPVGTIAEVVGAVDTRPATHVAIISHRAGSAAVMISEVLGIREVAGKELGPVVSGPSHITGAALMGGGDVVLLLDAGAIVQRCQAVPQPVAARARILVVDDSRGARAVVAGSLASSGFSTSVAASAAEALEVLAEQHIDALVVDFSMPHEDGVDLVLKVRRANQTLPIVMLSGVAKQEDQDRALQAGVNAFFEKADFREGALAAQLRDLLG